MNEFDNTPEILGQCLVGNHMTFVCIADAKKLPINILTHLQAMAEFDFSLGEVWHFCFLNSLELKLRLLELETWVELDTEVLEVNYDAEPEVESDTKIHVNSLEKVVIDSRKLLNWN